MRLNKYVALATGLSRRAADLAIQQGRVTVDGQTASTGVQVEDGSQVTLDERAITPPVNTTTVMLHKPRGYVVSRDGQGSPTIYELLPPQYHSLKPVGRLDKDSSGLLLLTNDGQLAHELTHPSKQKGKVYHVTLYKPLQPLHRQMISDHGVLLEDGPSKFMLERANEGDDTAWIVHMHEGRNRQIRRTFESLGYTVNSLHRTQLGQFSLGRVAPGQAVVISDQTDKLS